MYRIELSESALADLDDFSPAEVEEILAFLLSLEDVPRPAEAQSIPLSEAAGEVAYLYETELYSIFYEVVDAASLVRVAAIFKKISLN